jgi:hypothetical protein
VATITDEGFAEIPDAEVAEVFSHIVADIQLRPAPEDDE